MNEAEKRELIAEAEGIGCVDDESGCECAGSLIRRLADALEESLTGSEVTSIEELDALPEGSVVMEVSAEPFLGIPTVAGVFHKFPLAVQEPGRTHDEGWREWFVVAGHGARPAAEINLPARVLLRGPDV